MTDALDCDFMLKSRLDLNPSQMGNSPNVCSDLKDPWVLPTLFVQKNTDKLFGENHWKK